MKFFIIILIIFVFSCEKPPPSQIDRNCNCGIIIETTTGDGGSNPYPTTCGAEIQFGESSGTDNGRALIENNCTKNIREICTGPVSFTVSGGLYGWNLNSEWCDPNSNEGW